MWISTSRRPRSSDRVGRDHAARVAAARGACVPVRIGVYDTSFQQRHSYATAINDLDGHVLHVADGRDKQALEEYYKQCDTLPAISGNR